jgi:hypothetical protein
MWYPDTSRKLVMPDTLITLAEAATRTGRSRQWLATCLSLRSDAPPDRLYKRVSVTRLRELFPERAAVHKDAP